MSLTSMALWKTKQEIADRKLKYSKAHINEITIFTQQLRLNKYINFFLISKGIII